jgi:predicted ATP-grasp superfamily ATP-dependent carboligase
LIFEYISGGGYRDQKLSASILSEGYGMLRSLISDCIAAGHRVTTLLDSRLEAFNPPNEANKIIYISSPSKMDKTLTQISAAVDAVYFIAPESGQILERLVEKIESFGGTSLNCESEAIKRVSNKIKAYEIIKKIGLKIPPTVLVDIKEKTTNIEPLIKDLEYPLVFKPLDGVSCCGLSIVKNKSEIARAIKKIGYESMSPQFIVQKLIRGEAASACVISTGDQALAVTLNQQLVNLASPDYESKYFGGAVPINHDLNKESLKATEKLVEWIGGLKGYVGVDMILTSEGPVISEINPRLTTSYVGLTKVMNFNPAKAIIDATIGRKLPKNAQCKGYSFFSKVKVPSHPQIITDTYKLEEVISPPFPIKGNSSAYTLIATLSNSSKGAESAFYHTKKQLLNLYRGN